MGVTTPGTKSGANTRFGIIPLNTAPARREEGEQRGAGGGVARPLAGCGEERELCNGPNVGGCCVCAKPF